MYILASSLGLVSKKDLSNEGDPTAWPWGDSSLEVSGRTLGPVDGSKHREELHILGDQRLDRPLPDPPLQELEQLHSLPNH